MSDSFTDDSAFFGAISGDDSAFFGAYNFMYPNKPDHVSVADWRSMSPEVKQALIEGEGGGAAQGPAQQGPGFAMGAAPSGEDIGEVLGGIGTILGGILPSIVTAVKGDSQPSDPAQAPPGYYPPQQAPAYYPPAPTQPQGMSSGTVVLGGILGLGLFGTLITLLVRRTGAPNRGWRDISSALTDYEDLGFSQTFVDFL